MGHLAVQRKAEPREPNAQGSDRNVPASATPPGPSPGPCGSPRPLQLLLGQQRLHHLLILRQVVVQVVQNLLPPLPLWGLELGDVDGVQDWVEDPLGLLAVRLLGPVLGLELGERDHPVIRVPALRGHHLDAPLLGKLLEEPVVGDVLNEGHPLLTPLRWGEAVELPVELIDPEQELLPLEVLLLRAPLNALDVLLPVLGGLLDPLGQLPRAHEPQLVAVLDEVLDHIELLFLPLILGLPALAEEVLNDGPAPLQPVSLQRVLALLPVLLLVLFRVELDVLLDLLLHRVEHVLVPPGRVRALLEELLGPVLLGTLDVPPDVRENHRGLVALPRQVVHPVHLVVVLRDLGQVLPQTLVLRQGVGLAHGTRGHPLGAVRVKEGVLLHRRRGAPAILKVPQRDVAVWLMLEHPGTLDDRIELLEDALDESVVAKVLGVDLAGGHIVKPELAGLDVVDGIRHELVSVPSSLLRGTHDLVPSRVPGLLGRLPLLDELHHRRKVEHGAAAVLLPLDPLPPENLSLWPGHLPQALHSPGAEHPLVLHSSAHVGLHQVAGVRVSHHKRAVRVGNVLPAEALIGGAVIPNDGVPLQRGPGEGGVGVVRAPQADLGVDGRIPNRVGLEAVLVHHGVVGVDLLELLHLHLVRRRVVRGVPVEVSSHVSTLPGILGVRGLGDLHAVRVVLANLDRVLLCYPVRTRLGLLVLRVLLLQLLPNVLLDLLNGGVLAEPRAVRVVPCLQGVLVAVLLFRQVQVLL